MHPIEWIEWIIAAVILGSLIITAALMKGEKWRKAGRAAVFLYIISCILFFTLRPYWIDRQIAHKSAIVTNHLNEHYPNETWTLSAVPHREDGYESVNPYTIYIIFDNEPDVTYIYMEDDADHVYQSGYSTNKNPSLIQHREDFSRR